MMNTDNIFSSGDEDSKNHSMDHSHVSDAEESETYFDRNQHPVLDDISNSKLERAKRLLKS